MRRKTILYFLSSFIILFCWQTSLHAQVIAGEVPPGMSIHYPDLELKRWTTQVDTNGYLDINRDGSDDFRISLVKGVLELDGAHSVTFFPIDDKYSLCTNTAKNTAILYGP